MIRRPASFRPAIVALGLLIASCNQQVEQDKATAAGGEVLPGSISDEMIDLDTSTASPPLAPVKQAAPKKGAVEKADTPDDEEAEPAQAAAAPAAASADTQ